MLLQNASLGGADVSGFISWPQKSATASAKPAESLAWLIGWCWHLKEILQNLMMPALLPQGKIFFRSL